MTCPVSNLRSKGFRLIDISAFIRFPQDILLGVIERKSLKYFSKLQVLRLVSGSALYNITLNTVCDWLKKKQLSVC